MPTAAKKPDPAEQLRERLELARRAGLCFDDAWEKAWDRVRWPHETPQRRAWKQGLAWAREGYRDAYDGEATASRELTRVGA